MRLAAASLYAHAPRAVVVPLNLFGLTPELSALGQRWRVKDEFHVTAVSARWLAERLERDQGVVWASVVTAIEGSRAGTIRLGRELRVAAEGAERTLLVMARVDGLSDELSARLGAPLVPPPAHVTLYTRPDGEAIGLHDGDELRTLTRPLDDEQAAAVIAAAGLQALLDG